MDYKKKYLEYKIKYHLLKQTGGMPPKSTQNKAEAAADEEAKAKAAAEIAKKEEQRLKYIEKERVKAAEKAAAKAAAEAAAEAKAAAKAEADAEKKYREDVAAKKKKFDEEVAAKAAAEKKAAEKAAQIAKYQADQIEYKKAAERVKYNAIKSIRDAEERELKAKERAQAAEKAAVLPKFLEGNIEEIIGTCVQVDPNTPKIYKGINLQVKDDDKYITIEDLATSNKPIILDKKLVVRVKAYIKKTTRKIDEVHVFYEGYECGGDIYEQKHLCIVAEGLALSEYKIKLWHENDYYNPFLKHIKKILVPVIKIPKFSDICFVFNLKEIREEALLAFILGTTRQTSQIPLEVFETNIFPYIRVIGDQNLDLYDTFELFEYNRELPEFMSITQVRKLYDLGIIKMARLDRDTNGISYFHIMSDGAFEKDKVNGYFVFIQDMHERIKRNLRLMDMIDKTHKSHNKPNNDIQYERQEHPSPKF